MLYYSLQEKMDALHYASKGGHHDTVRVLLARGAYPSTRDKASGVYIMYELQMYLTHMLIDVHWYFTNFTSDHINLIRMNFVT